MLVSKVRSVGIFPGFSFLDGIGQGEAAEVGGVEETAALPVIDKGTDYDAGNAEFRRVGSLWATHFPATDIIFSCSFTFDLQLGSWLLSQPY